MIHAVIFTEGDFHETRTFESEALLAAFSAGFSSAASAYGAGGWDIVTQAMVDDPEERLDADVRAIARRHLRNATKDQP